MVFDLRNIIHPFQNKKYLKIWVNLNCNPQEYLMVTNKFKHKCFSVNTNLTVLVTLLYFT